MDAQSVIGFGEPLLPGHPDLHGVLEAELAGNLVGQQRSLRHQQANQIVPKQVDPQLLGGHVRSLAPQVLHSEGRLDVSQVQLNVPRLP